MCHVQIFCRSHVRCHMSCTMCITLEKASTVTNRFVLTVKHEWSAFVTITPKSREALQLVRSRERGTGKPACRPCPNWPRTRCRSTVAPSDHVALTGQTCASRCRTALRARGLTDVGVRQWRNHQHRQGQRTVDSDVNASTTFGVPRALRISHLRAQQVTTKCHVAKRGPAHSR